MVLSLLLPALLFFSPGIEPLKKELERGERLLKKKEEQYQKITRDLEELLNRKDKLLETLRELEKKDQDLEKKERELKEEIARKEKTLQLMSNHLQYSLALGYSLFAGGILERMIRIGNLDEGMRMKGGIRIVSERIHSSLNQTQELLSAREQDLKNLTRLSQDLVKTRERLSREKEELETLEVHLKEKVSELKNEIEFRRRYVQDIRSELKKLLEEFGPETPGASLPSLIPPVEAPLFLRYGKIKDPVFGVEIFHPGWTYRVAPGTTVRAAASGEVLFYGWVRGYGNLLILKHPGGWFTLYGHLKESHLRPGDHAEQGDPIALSGDSGSLYGPTLQFEVRKGKDPINPHLLLKKR